MPLNLKTSKFPSGEKILHYFILFAIGWYVLLCTVQYFYQRPLWNDEQAVFLSVQGFSPLRMFTEKLELWQVFPRVYLFIIQQVSQIFDFHLLSLRLPAFICMMMAFFLWLKIAGYGLKTKLDYLTFVLCFTASAMMIYYASELKQYSMDVMAGAVFLSIFYRQKQLEEAGGKSYRIILALLPFLGLLSYTSYLFMMVMFYNLVVSVVRDKRMLSSLLIFAGSFAVVFVCSYLFDMRFRHLDAVTSGFGDYFISYTSVGEFFKSFGEGVNNLISRWFAERPRIIRKLAVPFVSLGLMNLFYSFFANFKKEGFYLRSLETIGFILFVELFILGSLKKYMFTVPRTSLFFCPIIFYFTVRSLTQIKQWQKPVGYVVHSAFLVYVLFLTVSLSRITLSGHLGFAPTIF